MLYFWVQVYLMKELVEQKVFVFMVSIDVKCYVDIKIDIVGLKDDDLI